MTQRETMIEVRMKPIKRVTSKINIVCSIGGLIALLIGIWIDWGLALKLSATSIIFLMLSWAIEEGIKRRVEDDVDKKLITETFADKLKKKIETKKANDEGLERQ